MSKLNELTTITPTIDDYVPSLDASVPTTLQKTTWQAIRDLFKTYFDTVYQALLVSGTNIKTVNGTTLLGSGNLAIAVFTDGDKGDITVSSSATVLTIDNDVVTNAKMANMATATIKGRTTAGTGDPEDLTATQATALLNTATTSLKGLMSSADKTKLDGLTTFIGCSLSNSTSQTLTADTFTAPAWDTEEYDGGFHSGSQNQITIPTTGYYLFTLNLNINVLSGRYNMFIYSSSGKQINSCQSIDGLSASFSDGVSISGMFKCSAGDVVNSGVYLSGTSGNDRTLLATNSYFNASLIGI